MRHLSATSLGLALLLAFGGAVTAQDETSEPTVGLATVLPEVQPAVVPVADYWGEWNLHKKEVRQRLRIAIQNARNARSNRVGFYRALLTAHHDEMRWLANHQPEACYAGEYAGWRAAVEDLRALAKRSVAFARTGNAAGLKRVAQQRRAPMKRLGRLVAHLADCVDSEPPPVAGDPFVGKWLARPVYVDGETGFVDRSPRRLTISDSGRVLMRIPRHPYCRKLGYGLVPFVLKGRGETVVDGTPRFHSSGRFECHPRGRAPVVINRFASGVWDYDPATDVLLIDSECYWRTTGGGAENCTAFWRGTAR